MLAVPLKRTRDVLVRWRAREPFRLLQHDTRRDLMFRQCPQWRDNFTRDVSHAARITESETYIEDAANIPQVPRLASCAFIEDTPSYHTG
jgi:hypothetical protein